MKTTEVWIFLITGSVAAGLVPSLGFIATHGKTAGSKSTALPVLNYLASISVQKQWFTYFYIVGVAMSYYCLQYTSKDSDESTVLMLFMFLLQCSRRTLECLSTSYGSSTMHISHLFVGLAHYVCVPIALLAAEPIKFPFARNFACWLVFFMFSFIQYRCHAMLNDMKIAQLRSGKYKFPKGFLFDFVTCPHYFAEIGIYASILLLNPSHMEGWLVLIWVSSNLAVVSHVQYNWYKEKFPDEVPPSWKRLLPFVW